MTEQELIEALADKEHAGWSSYMAYLFSKLESNPDGSLTIPAGYVAALQIQIDTPYAELSEQEKQGDRDEVAHILPIIQEYAHSEPRNATPLETIDLRLHRIENTLAQSRENPSMSLLDLSALTQTIARMDQQIRRLDTEVFGISIGKDDTTERTRQTLL